MMHLLVCLSFFLKCLLWAWIAQLLIAGLFLLRYALGKLRRFVIVRARAVRIASITVEEGV
jgi:hypothetical protein